MQALVLSKCCPFIFANAAGARAAIGDVLACRALHTSMRENFKALRTQPACPAPASRTTAHCAHALCKAHAGVCPYGNACLQSALCALHEGVAAPGDRRAARAARAGQRRLPLQPLGQQRLRLRGQPPGGARAKVRWLCGPEARVGEVLQSARERLPADGGRPGCSASRAGCVLFLADSNRRQTSATVSVHSRRWSGYVV